MSNNHSAEEFGRNLAAGAARYAIELEASVTNGPIYRHRVHLEPSYRMLDPVQTFIQPKDRSIAVVGRPTPWVFRKLIRARAEAIDWRRAATVIERQAGCEGPISFEIWLTDDRVSFYLGASPAEIDFVAAAWSAVFPECALVDATAEADDPTVNAALLYELMSPAGYQAAIHASQAVSPWTTIFQLYASLPPGERAICEVVFAPARSPFGKNIAAIIATERALGHRSPLAPTATAKRGDEPLFAAMVRIIATSPLLGRGIESFAGTFTAEGKPFRYRTKEDYLRVLSEPTVRAMCRDRAAYTPGQLFTASELSLFVHLPSTEAAGKLSQDLVHGLPVPERLRGRGIPAGINSHRGVPASVHLPSSMPNRCTWRIGSSRSGKTSDLVHHFHHLALEGEGALFLDAHRETALALPGLLKDVDPDRLIHLDFDADPPVAYNPFCYGEPEDFGRIALESVQSFRSLFDTDGLHRTMHFLGMGIYGLKVVQGNIATLPILFTPDGERHRRQIIAHAPNHNVRRFWQEEYPRHRPEVFAPIVNRLSAVLLDDRTNRALSQRENKVDLASAMNKRKVISVALPANFEGGKIIGGLMIAECKHAAFRRIGTPEASRHFTLFIDESHRFLPSADAIESVIHETAKGGLSVALANQETGQLPNDLLKAMFSIPTIMVFGVNLPDARMLAPLFNGHVTPETLASQRTGEVYARIQQEIVNYTTLPPLADHDAELAARVIADSRAKYHSTSPVAEAPLPRRGRNIEAF